MKLGLVRCLKTEEICTTSQCLADIKQRRGELAEETNLKLVGTITCGGCPGKKLSLRAEKMLTETGADKVVLSSCITASGNCSLNSSSCPHWSNIKQSLQSIVKEKKVIKL